MTTKELTDVIKSAASTSGSIGNLITAVTASGELKRATMRDAANFTFGTVSNSENLDNPTTRGIFNVNTNTIITKPTKGSGWDYGYVINLTISSGIQIWFNFNGYIAVRGKTNSTASWSDWSVMQKMT